MEDLDTARTVPGAAELILRQLESLGFWWDGPVLYQSRRLPLYEAALSALARRDDLYACSCSRRDLGASDDLGGYPGHCRQGPRQSGPTAWRLRADRYPLEPFVDAVLGERLGSEGAGGDPIVRRRDGVFAYQLAVVVDDAASGITHVVRGADLLASTAWQRALQRALNLPTPAYAHIPLLLDGQGRKVSKSTQALDQPLRAGAAVLHQVLTLLRHAPPASLIGAPVGALWDWSLAHWSIGRLRGVGYLALDARVD